jgi:hypothetical protein
MKIHIDLPSKEDKPDYLYTKVVVKSINLEKYLKEKVLIAQDFGILYDELVDDLPEEKRNQTYLIVSDSKFNIVILNLNPILRKYFKPFIGGERGQNPFNCCNKIMDEPQYEKLFEKHKRSNVHFSSQ